jgi:hypothetical protein
MIWRQRAVALIDTLCKLLAMSRRRWGGWGVAWLVGVIVIVGCSSDEAPKGAARVFTDACKVVNMLPARS